MVLNHMLVYWTSLVHLKTNEMIESGIWSQAVGQSPSYYFHGGLDLNVPMIEYPYIEKILNEEVGMMDTLLFIAEQDNEERSRIAN